MQSQVIKYLLLAGGVVVVLAVGGLLFWQLASNKPETLRQTASVRNANKNAVSPEPYPNSDEPPLKIKSIGVNLDYYDPKSGQAGDFLFTKLKLQFNRLFMGFGFIIPSNVASSGKDKSNPQPTFILPVGTPVRALVDGTIANVPTLWSGDYSIMITTDGKLQKWVYETEHLVNPKVKVGDKVTAGQIVGEVGNFNNNAPSGFGTVEIGILKGGNPPQHVCPFAYLDPSIKEETLKKINAFFQSWEDYIGDQTLYDQQAATPGCLTIDPIDG